MEHIDTLVIGAGVVGIAIAAKLSEKTNTILIEQGQQFGEHSSSRNSEVIHAGLYYPTESLKAQLCVRGKHLLYQHCKKYHIPNQVIGKILTAQNSDEADTLHRISRQAVINGVHDLQFLSTTQIPSYAPDIKASYGIWSPSTGIIDSHQYMLSLLTQLQQNQGLYVPNTQFVAAQKDRNGFIVELNCAGESYELQCQTLINAGGLFAQHNTSLIDSYEKQHNPSLYYCRGQYFSYQGKHNFKHLIYPIPDAHGLGIHATLDLAGQLKFGPDTQFVPHLDYQVDPERKALFVRAIKRYWPALDTSKLQVDYAGIRAKTTLSGTQDFTIQTQKTHGIPGLINLFGIESPGLTASLAIAEYVQSKL